VNDHSKTGLLRVTHFTEFATVVGSKVKAMSTTMPYGILTVESPEMKSSFNLWLTHCIDFSNVWLAHEYVRNLERYDALLRKRIVHLEDIIGNQIDKLGDIYNWLQNSRRPEILVGYFASLGNRRSNWLVKLLVAGLPKLYIWICPEGYLAQAVSDNFRSLDSLLYFEVIKPLAKWEPKV